MKKYLVIFIILISLLSACNKVNSHKDDAAVQDPGGYKPIIYYHGKLYGIEDCVKELPENFIDSGDKIVASEKDVYTLPTEECHTTGFNSQNVGATIYIDPNDEDIICINEVEHENLYTLFTSE